MANRPVFVPISTFPYTTTIPNEFNWNSGLAVSQKQKNIAALHHSFIEKFPDKKVLEISSKSMQEGGVQLSAFNLKKYVPSIEKSVPVEVIYHSGKVFENGGPYIDLLHGSSREAKKDERLKNSGELKGFCYEGKTFPLNPQTLFYDYLYLNALLENEKLAEIILQYDGFTDIEFNPNKSISCQAKSAALFVSLTRLDATNKIQDFDEFIEIWGLKCK